MVNRDSAFFSISKSVAENFLQTVVIVDDQAFFENTRMPAEPADFELVEPVTRHKVEQGDYQSAAFPDNQISNGPSHLLDAKLVIDGFAQKGIVCSVLKPEKQDSDMVEKTIPKLAACADIIILDWDLNKDKGQAVLQLIENVVTKNDETPHQLRLIVVYTGEGDIAGVTSKIISKLPLLEKSIDENGLSFNARSVRIVTFAKPQTQVAHHLVSHRIEFSQLANVVTEEFAAMTSGLVSNVVLESLAQIRRNTHKILNNFSADLDAPYLTHRILHADPDDAEEQLTALVVGELQAILEEGKVTRKIDLETIKAWIDDKLSKPSFQLETNDRPLELTQEKLIELLKTGVEKWLGFSSRQRDKAHKFSLTKMFLNQSADHQLDDKFAVVTTLRSFYAQGEHRLTLGTIVEHDGSFLICIQPKCDTYRILEARAFPFLPLSHPEPNHSNFDIIVKQDNRYIRLSISKKPYNLKLASFKPDEKQVVTTTNHVFVDTEGNKFKWIGELRTEQAQRLSHRFATELSRVGVNESQWLRRWASKD